MVRLKSNKGSAVILLTAIIVIAVIAAAVVSKILALATPKLAALCGAELKYDGLQLFAGWLVLIIIIYLISQLIDLRRKP